MHYLRTLLFHSGRVVILALVLTFGRPAFTQSFPPAWNAATSTYKVGDIVQGTSGNWYRAIKSDGTANHSPLTAYSYWELNNVLASTAIDIGQGDAFTSLQIAWTYIAKARIASSVKLYLVFSTTPEAVITDSFTGSFSLDHPFGSSIVIESPNVSSNTILSFPNGGGFTLDSGHVLGGLINLTIQGAFAPVSGSQGIFLTGGASIPLLENLIISQFACPIFVQQNASATGAGSITLERFTTAGCTAQDGGSVNLTGSALTVDNTSFGSSPTGVGLCAMNSGRISAEASTVKGVLTGVQSYLDGLVDVNRASISADNAKSYSLDAEYGGHILAQSSKVSANATTDTEKLDNVLYESWGGFIDAVGSDIATHLLGLGYLDQFDPDEGTTELIESGEGAPRRRERRRANNSHVQTTVILSLEGLAF